MSGRNGKRRKWKKNARMGQRRKKMSTSSESWRKNDD